MAEVLHGFFLAVYIFGWFWFFAGSVESANKVAYGKPDWPILVLIGAIVSFAWPVLLVLMNLVAAICWLVEGIEDE